MINRRSKTVLEIKRMLYEEGYTIMGLKRHWRRRRGGERPAIPGGQVQQIKEELRDIVDRLKDPSRQNLPS